MNEHPTSEESYRKSPYSSIKHSTYFAVYDRLFGPYRGKPVTFMEIGVLNGGSLFMWRDFFGPEARIIGVDLNPLARKWESEGFEIFIGSQSDSVFWDEVKKKVGPIDLLLDDGGHTFEQQIVTVEAMLPVIRDGGLLVVEDTHTSYMRAFGAPSARTFIAYANNIVDGINRRFSELDGPGRSERQVYGVSFFESFVAFHVDRAMSCVASVPTDNGGVSMDAKDLRNADPASAQAKRRIPAGLDFIKRLPFFDRLRRFANERDARRRLDRYFKY